MKNKSAYDNFYDKTTLYHFAYNPNGVILALQGDKRFKRRLNQLRSEYPRGSTQPNSEQQKGSSETQLEGEQANSTTKPTQNSPQVPKPQASPVNQTTANHTHKPVTDRYIAKTSKGSNQETAKTAVKVSKPKERIVDTGNTLFSHGATTPSSQKNVELAPTELKKQLDQQLSELSQAKKHMPVYEFRKRQQTLKEQLNLLKTNYGLYLIKTASDKETSLATTDLTTPAWSSIIAHYEVGITNFSPTTKKEHGTKKTALYRLAVLYQSLKRWPETFDTYAKIIQAYPHESKVYYQRAIAYSLLNTTPTLGDIQSALADIERALKLNQEHPSDLDCKHAQTMQQQLSNLLAEHERSLLKRLGL